VAADGGGSVVRAADPADASALGAVPGGPYGGAGGAVARGGGAGGARAERGGGGGAGVASGRPPVRPARRPDPHGGRGHPGAGWARRWRRLEVGEQRGGAGTWRTSRRRCSTGCWGWGWCRARRWRWWTGGRRVRGRGRGRVGSCPDPVRGEEHVLGAVDAANVTVERLPAGRRAAGRPVRWRRRRWARRCGWYRGSRRRARVRSGVVCWIWAWCRERQITPELVSASGDPVAYRVRGALIALRREQASWIESRRSPVETTELIGDESTGPGGGRSPESESGAPGSEPDRWDYLVAWRGTRTWGRRRSSTRSRGSGSTRATGRGRRWSRAEGAFAHEGRRVKVVDLPGTYSLQAGSADEEVARDFIVFGRPDVTVVVVDATRLERNLNLVLQVLEITDRVVVCLNLMDEARRHGVAVDAGAARAGAGRAGHGPPWPGAARGWTRCSGHGGGRWPPAKPSHHALPAAATRPRWSRPWRSWCPPSRGPTRACRTRAGSRSGC
jgi:hypothetical protein